MTVVHGLPVGVVPDGRPPLLSRWARWAALLTVCTAVLIGIAAALVLCSSPSRRGLVVGAALALGYIVCGMGQFFWPLADVRKGVAVAAAAGTFAAWLPVGFTIGPVFYPTFLLWLVVAVMPVSGSDGWRAWNKLVADGVVGAVIGLTSVAFVWFLAIELLP